MFRNRKVFLIFVGLCTVIGCDAQYDYFSQISSYVRSGSSKIADAASSYYDEYSQTKTAADIRDAYEKTYSYVRSGGSKIADAASSYYDEYSQTKAAADISDAYDKTYSYIRSGSSKIADTLSSYFNEYTLMPSKLNVPEEHDEPLKDRRKAEDTNNYSGKKFYKYTETKDDISEEALSRRIVNMLLSRTDMRSNGSMISGRVKLEATPSEFEALKDFGFGISTLREIAPILNNVIKTSKKLTNGINDN